MTGEASSHKLLSHLSSKAAGVPSAPATTLTVPGCGGINDACFSPDGSRLAVACRDGSVRLLDWQTGTCLEGYQVTSFSSPPLSLTAPHSNAHHHYIHPHTHTLTH